MAAWFISDFDIIIVSRILVMIVAAIIVSMVNKKKQGKSSCGCANCVMKGTCHK